MEGFLNELRSAQMRFLLYNLEDVVNHTSYGEGEVGEVDRRVSELLSSPLGCAFLVVIDSSNISHSAAAEPSVSIRAAALAAKSVNVHRVDHEEILESVFRRARLLQSPGPIDP